MRRTVRAVVIKDNNLLVMYRNKFGRKYLSLVGGEVEPGEQLEQALTREVKEETTLEIANYRLIIEEDAGEIYGMQYIYLCDYVSGEPKLSPESNESKINAGGQNLYLPKWLPLNELDSSNLLPKELKQLLSKQIKEGFPDQPTKLSIPKDSEI